MKSKDLLLFLSLLVLCMPRDGAVFQQCVCSVYASNKGGLVSTNFIRDKKHVIPRLGCDNQARDMCAGLCRYRFSMRTSGGNMLYISPKVGITVGQLFCNWIGREVINETVVLYSEICREKPSDTGFKMTQNLGCVSGNFVNFE
ncbi:uncharacterized protein LOC111087751 isoform X1 [Limulus polyphemus]|uniref:Uncharacterized protein LOC111087751 isoform X1 n=1 Tax=Limulus polyphemus TaxID=6850 RepID=A0ABM1T5S5_LIMPO|nr:uncharacterized protein LOC111087751 isoform X1 [Limulus polyphemus]